MKINKLHFIVKIITILLFQNSNILLGQYNCDTTVFRFDTSVFMSIICDKEMVIIQDLDLNGNILSKVVRNSDSVFYYNHPIWGTSKGLYVHSDTVYKSLLDCDSPSFELAYSDNPENTDTQVAGDGYYLKYNWQYEFIISCNIDQGIGISNCWLGPNKLKRVTENIDSNKVVKTEIFELVFLNNKIYSKEIHSCNKKHCNFK